MKSSLAVRLAPWLATLALFVVWEAAVRDLQDPGILPAAADRRVQGDRRLLAGDLQALAVHA